jgi:MFS family permease
MAAKLFSGLNRDVWLMSACQALCNTSTAITISAAALVGAMLAEDKSFATFPHAIYWVATMAFSVLASLLMRSAGRRVGFLAGALCGLIGSLGGAWAIYLGSFYGFIAASIVLGGFNAVAMLYRFAAAEMTAPAVRAKSIALVIGGGIVAALIGPEIAKHTVNAFPPYTFMGTYAALGAVPLLLAAVIAFIRLPPPPSRVRGPSGRPLRAIMAQRNFIVAVLAGMIGWGGMVLVMTATPLSMVACGHTFDDSAFVIQWHIVGMFAPSFFTGGLIARYGLARVMYAGVALMAAGIVAGVTGLAVTNFLLINVLAGVGWNFLFVGGTALLTSVYRPEERNKVEAVNDFLVFGMVALSSFTSGWLHNLFGWDAVAYALIPSLAVMLAAIVWFSSARRAGAARA